MIMDKPTYSLFQELQTPHLDRLSFTTTSAKDVAVWVSNLSLLQLGDTSRTLFEALLEIRNLKCEESVRYELIEVLRPALTSVIESLEKQFLHQGLINNERNDQVIELVIQLRFHWTMVYLEITRRIHQRLNEDNFSLFAFKLKKDLKNIRVMSTYQGLLQISGLIFQHQILYHDYPVGIWLASHQLYYMAEQEGFHTLNINQINHNPTNLSSIHLVYTQILLLNILNPNQLRQSEIQAIYSCSFDWCKLLQLTNIETPTSTFIIDKDKDLPPIHNNHIQQVYESHYFVNTLKLLEHINQALTKNAVFLSKTEKQQLNAPIKFHLQNILGNAAERRHERYEYNAPIDVCFGLSTAHFYLSHGKSFNESLEMDGRFDLQSNAQILQKFNNVEPSQETQQINRMNRQIYQAHVLDISVNGYRLKWSAADIPKALRTGEIMLVKENAQLHWRLAVIRWIKQSPEKFLEMGLEILAQEIYPMAVTVIPDKNTINYHPALLLSNQLFEQRKNTLILPGSQMFKGKQSVTIRFQTHEIKVYLEKPLLITQSFSHFEFDIFDDVHSAMIEGFKEDHASLSKSKDIWDALK